MALASKDSVGGGLTPFFKAADHGADLALIFEPLSVRKDVPGNFGPRDHVKTKVTVFRSEGDLDKKEPASIGTFDINDKNLAKDLVELMDEAKAKGDNSPALIATLQHYQPKGGGRKTWVFRQPQDADYDKAAAYYEAREAKLQAALADVPDF